MQRSRRPLKWWLLVTVLALSPLQARQIFEERGLQESTADLVDAVPIDFDGDGDTDLAIISDADGRIRLVESLGGGAVALGSDPIGFEPGAVRGVAADLDFDGDEDVLIAGVGGDLALWRNDGPGQPWTRSVVAQTLIGTDVDLAFRDFSGDGLEDLVLQRGSVLGWFERQPSGALGPYVVLGTGAPRKIQFADTNGDGISDILTRRTNSTIAWISITGPGQLSHPYAAGTLADVDGDGLLDMICIEQVDVFAGFGSEFFAQLGRGLAGGQFAPFEGRGRLTSRFCDVSAGFANAPLVTAVPSALGTGLPDIAIESGCTIASPPFCSRSVNVGPASWTDAPSRFSVKPDRFADIDADGDLDVLYLGPTSLDWSQRNPDGTVGVRGPLFGARTRALPMYSSDLNRDGWPEIVATPGVTAGAFVFDGQGNGAFAGPTLIPGGTLSQDRQTVHAGDLNGDGNPDLAFLFSSSSIGWIPGDGQGGFGPPGLVTDATSLLRLNDMQLGDIDGDGRLDLVAYDVGQFIVHWRGLGGGAFASAEYAQSGPADQIILSDIERDGDLDALCFSPGASTRPALLHRWDGASFLPAEAIGVTGPVSPSALDADTDGDLDLAYISGGQLLIQRNDGAQGWAPGAALPSTSGLRPQAVAGGDVDGDGDDDLVASYLDGQGLASVGSLEQTPAGFVDSGRVSVALAPTSLTLSDVDADGDIDGLGNGPAFVSWYENLLDHGHPVGASVCSPAIRNSTGLPGKLRARGSEAITQADITLIATCLPYNATGFFLASRTEGGVFPLMNSQGRLCLGGSIGSYYGPGQVQSTGTTGTLTLPLDLSAMPTPSGFVAAQPGDTWYFQAWFRDSDPLPTSHLTDAVAITLQ